MPTDNPKISSYVPQQIYDRFKKYQTDQNLTMSQAVIVILTEYFGLEETLKETTSSLPVGGVTLKAFQELQQRLTKLESEVESLKPSSEHKNITKDETIDIQLNSTHLAKRFTVGRKMIDNYRNKSTEEFTEWSTKKDVDGIAWIYKKVGIKYIFYPARENDSRLLGELQKWVDENIK